MFPCIIIKYIQSAVNNNTGKNTPVNANITLFISIYTPVFPILV